MNLNTILQRPALVILLAMLLPACKSVSEAPPPPTPVTLRLAYTPALRPWVGRLAACAEKQPETAMFLEEVPIGLFNLEQYEAVLSLGDTGVSSSFSYTLGYDDLKIIVNPKNPVSSLGQAELNDLFEGSLSTWEMLSPANAVYVVSVQVWFYLPESELAHLVGNYLHGSITNTANLASDPGQVIEAVMNLPGAVGFVTESWLVGNPEGVKMINLPGKSSSRQIPVLAMTESEPQGSLRSLLACASEAAK